MDFTVLYVLGTLSAVHLLLAGLTGKSIERHRTTDRKQDPKRYKYELAVSWFFVATALLVAATSWVARMTA